MGIMGFGFVFKLEDDSVERHKGDRKIRGLEETIEVDKSDIESVTESLEDVEIDVEGGESSEGEKEEVKLECIDEEGEKDNKENVPKVEDNPSENTNEDDNTEDEIEIENEEKHIDELVSEFPDTDVRVGFDRLGSVEIKTRSVSVSEEPESAVATGAKKPNKKEKKKVVNNANQKEI